MPEISLDFGNVGKVPEGYFRVQITKPIYQSNNNHDGMIIKTQMKCIDMPPEFEDFEGHVVFDQPSFKPTALWKTQEFLHAFTGEDWTEDGMKLEYACIEDCEISHDNIAKCPHEKIIPILVDATAVALLKREVYNDRPSAKPQHYLVDDGTVEFGANITE